MDIFFDWDENKAKANLLKHGVSFEEAKSVFSDEFARIFDDLEYSTTEYREIIFGYSNKNRLLIVNFTERNRKVRIISARKVTKNERKLYEEFQ